MRRPPQYPHLKARNFFVETDRPDIGPHKLTGPAWKMSDTPGRIRRSGPLLGQDNDYIFSQLLGRSSGELDDLSQLGVLT